MSEIFVDTSFWKALADRNDTHHQSASIWFNNNADKVKRLVTSNLIFCETVTLLRMRPGLGHAVAVAWGDKIQKSKLVETLWVSEAHFKKAWSIFGKYDDKLFSFVDCTSFAMMSSMRIKTALAFDEDFVKYGYVVLPIN